MSETEGSRDGTSQANDNTGSDTAYTVDLNGSRYELNRRTRESIEARAANEYEENSLFSYWWKVASPDQYQDEDWQENIHEQGDPILVIETQGKMVPWERLDELNVEMEDATHDSSTDDSTASRNSGTGMQTIDPNDMSGSNNNTDPDMNIGRTHFEQTPQRFEEIASPDGESDDKIPAAPTEIPDHPVMVKWMPDNPSVEHTWAAGEALTETYSWVEWNVQQYANQPRVYTDDDNTDGHNHWEALLKRFGCDVVATQVPTQKPQQKTGTSNTNDAGSVDDMGPRAGGNNWRV